VLEEDGKESTKFRAAHPEYVPSFENFLVLLDWLWKSNKTAKNSIVNETAFSFVARNKLWTFENLEKAYKALTATGSLEIYRSAPGPIERASKTIVESKATTVLPKDLEEVIVACKAEMYLHYYMTAQECLQRATVATMLQSAIEIAAEGLVALDRAEECGATMNQTRKLKNSLQSIGLHWVEKKT
jgi:hypothetical protein